MEKTKTLRTLLENIVKENRAEGILLSGGLDTSVLASLLRRKSLTAITVAVGKHSPDLYFARKLAKKFGWNHVVVRTDYEKLLKKIPCTIGLFRSFDPMTLRNNVVIHLALEKAKSLGLKSVMTGDGGDELFAGYRFIFEKQPRAMLYSLRRMWKIMHFSSIELGKSIGIKIIAPYIDSKIKSFVKKLRPSDFVTDRRGTKFGKAILRYTFAEELPEGFIWREKAPIEVGSGSAGITEYIEKLVPDSIFENERKRILDKDKVKIRTKEQYQYYLFYRSLFGSPQAGRGPRPSKNGKVCPDCGCEVVPPEGKFCRTCGLWPAC